MCFVGKERVGIAMGSAGPNNPWCGVFRFPSTQLNRLNQPEEIRRELSTILSMLPGEEKVLEDLVEATSKQQDPRGFGSYVVCNKMATGCIVVIGDAAHNISPVIG